MPLILGHDYSPNEDGKYVLLRRRQYETGFNPCNVVKTKYYHIDSTGVVTVNKGYVWDGATGAIDTKNFMLGSLIHDVFCDAIAAKLLHKSWRKKADQLLYKIVMEDDMPKIRAAWVYVAVRLYARMKY